MAPAEPQRTSPELLARFHPDLVAAAELYRVELPLVRGPFGYRDAADQRVRADTLTRLQRATPKGRRGRTYAAVGVGAAAGGLAAGMGSAIYSVAWGELKPGVGALGVGGAAVGVSGIVMLVTGQAMAHGSLYPQ